MSHVSWTSEVAESIGTGKFVALTSAASLQHCWPTPGDMIVPKGEAWMILYAVPGNHDVENKDDMRIMHPMFVVARVRGWLQLLTERGLKWTTPEDALSYQFEIVRFKSR